MVAFCLFLLFVPLFVFLFLVSICLHALFLPCPFLAAMSFAGYFLVRFILSAFPDFFFSERVSGLIWFGSVYLVTMAGFIEDQLI